jgi:2-phosphoglycerate kinase
MVLERRGRIRFRRRDNELDWFSRRLHQKRLERCGLPIDTASELAQAVYQEFVASKSYEVRSGEIDRVTLDLLEKELGGEFAERYRSWSRFDRGDGILVLLCGGAPGVGKSTLAAEIATRLDIVRTQSTDMLREIMREMVPAALVPELHGSSFDVNLSVDSKDIGDLDEGNMFHGFRRQAELVQLASRAVLARAQRESVSVLVEGVHIWPGLLRNQVTLGREDVMVELILTVADQKQLVRRFRQRGREAPGRRGKRYLDNIDTIWAQQSMLIQEAKNQAVPIVQNKDQEAATVDIMGLVSAAIVAQDQGH